MTNVVIKPTRAKKASTVLRKAKELLEEESDVKWCKGASLKGDRKLSVCALGAVEVVTFGAIRVPKGRGRTGGSFDTHWLGQVNDTYTRASNALNDAAFELGGCSGAAWFNDRPKTKKTDVLELFDRAIEIAARREKKRVRPIVRVEEWEPF